MRTTAARFMDEHLGRQGPGVVFEDMTAASAGTQ
jgi:hypothetical protein